MLKKYIITTLLLSASFSAFSSVANIAIYNNCTPEKSFPVLIHSNTPGCEKYNQIILAPYSSSYFRSRHFELKNVDTKCSFTITNAFNPNLTSCIGITADNVSAVRFRLIGSDNCYCGF